MLTIPVYLPKKTTWIEKKMIDNIMLGGGPYRSGGIYMLLRKAFWLTNLLVFFWRTNGVYDAARLKLWGSSC